MTYEEAVEAVAKDRGCTPDELAVCTPTFIAECGDDTCCDVRQFMQHFGSKPVVVDSQAALTEPVREQQSSNPKTLMGALKVPNLSVIPFTALIRMAQALEYGAYHAPRRDGGKGYRPFNWRDNDIEYMTYVEANVRHVASAADREDIDPDTGDLQVWHLAEAMATLAILIDAIENKTVIDNRPKNAHGRVAQLLRELRKKI